ncbi:stage V sporulation protein AA [Cytobacillus spongiae]|uniref:stage V sporulation protein AA n=1 Tax=Cytobacillus spongiae TaxID=2901381 RepID=UPI001F2796DF|nr:stage V sporulation protein AA [Cytobacillus spongiae]UII57950.1 stage V sporulation protein AA [Cytobacillus spongiae]
METTVYIRMRHRIQVRPHDTVVLQDIAQIITDDAVYEELKTLPIHQVSTHDQNIIIVDVMRVVKGITEVNPEYEVQTIGSSQTIIEVVFKKKGVSIPFFILIWLLLFFGAALAIMNFHEDVSMQSVHQRIYKLITGRAIEQPLIFQIPYSIGLGLGMILFFNHVFRKRINEEPSPLEVEMFNYQQDLDQYVIMNENKESMKQLHDH